MGYDPDDYKHLTEDGLDPAYHQHLDPAYRPSANASGTMAPDVPYSTYLPFDMATYTAGRVPCQLLPSAFYLSAVRFHVELPNGICVPVQKSFITDRMSNGCYVWVESEGLMDLSFQPLPSLQVGFAETQDQYAPRYTRLLSDRQLETLLSKVHGYKPSARGRVRQYYPDGKTSVSRNLSTLKPKE